MKNIKIVDRLARKHERCVHSARPESRDGELTLCGMMIGWKYEETDSKVDCPECLKVIEYVQTRFPKQ